MYDRTYDLHGQWDYGNPNAYDSCPSGKCIRSHGKLVNPPAQKKPDSQSVDSLREHIQTNLLIPGN